MQMWTLGRFLPLVIGQFIDTEDNHWCNFLRLLDIIDILFSKRIPVCYCGYLESLISDHHFSFRDLYPSSSVTPKLHSMVHLPRLILMLVRMM